MSIITIDLDEAILRLRNAGYDETQIAVILRALSDVKNRQINPSISHEFSEIRVNFRIVKWSLFVLYMLILVLLFFPPH